MTLKELAQELVAANREKRVPGLLEAHYSPDCVSVEAVPMPGSDSRDAIGLEAIRAKHAWWESSMEVLEETIDGPFLHGDDRFAVLYRSTVRERSSGTQTAMEEVAVYHVADGKVVREEFFYTMP